MKLKYKWMNEGKEFELPDFTKMNPQERLDILYQKAKAENKFKDIKPEGIRPKKKELTSGWNLYLNMVSIQHNLDIVVYALQTIDPEVTKETIMKNLPEDRDIAEIINQLFRVGKKTPKKKKTSAQPKNKS